MKINWLLVSIVVANLILATTGDICAKLWGTSNNYMWFYIGAGINVFTLLSFMLIVKYGNLSTTTAVVLLLTISMNVLIGFIAFHEKINVTQWIGIGLGLVAIIFILDVFKFSN